MTKQVRQRLHSVLKAEMQARFAEFVLRRDIRVPPGDLVFSWTHPAGVTFFIVLEVNQDSEAFNIALAWSVGGGDLPRFVAMSPTDPPVSQQHRFALHRLWDNPSTRDPWHWRVVPLPRLGDSTAWLATAVPTPELIRRVEDSARQAVDGLAAHATPYFLAVLEEYKAGRI
jgi:hypothetical protein